MAETPSVSGDGGGPLVVDAKSFRHFIRSPKDNERHGLFSGASGVPEEPEKLLEKLSASLKSAEIWREPIAQGFESWENPTISAGYTYLMQLIAHDLVQSSTIFPTLESRVKELRNNRSFQLDLDTLYGSGPSSCPHAYTSSDQFGFRSRLRLSAMRPSSPSVEPAAPPHRDIGRGIVKDGNGFQWRRKLLPDTNNPGGPQRWEPLPTEAMLADPRNDDNSNLSQLLTVFIWLHNTVIDLLEKGASNPGVPSEVAVERTFLEARKIVSTIYRNIIRADLLPKILHPDVQSFYKDAKAAEVDDESDRRTPIEFSHAVFRFGHAMIRSEYKLNALAPPFNIADILRTNSSREPYSVPLDEKWIIRWSHFFEVGNPSDVNWSRRIGPSYASALEVPPGIGFPRDGAPTQLGLRDLMRGASANLWSVPALLKEIAGRSGKLEKHLGLKDEFKKKSKALSEFLKENPGSNSNRLSEMEIEAISADPPMLYYILFEAMADTDGQRLGKLGSIIVCETMLRHLPDPPAAPGRGPVDEKIDALVGAMAMPDLLRELSKAAGLKSAKPAFL